MVYAIINIEDRANRVINMIKAKYCLKDKSQAINIMAKEYEESLLEPELRPQYIEKIRRIQQQGKFKTYKRLSDLRKETDHA